MGPRRSIFFYSFHRCSEEPLEEPFCSNLNHCSCDQRLVKSSLSAAGCSAQPRLRESGWMAVYRRQCRDAGVGPFVGSEMLTRTPSQPVGRFGEVIVLAHEEQSDHAYPRLQCSGRADRCHLLPTRRPRTGSRRGIHGLYVGGFGRCSRNEHADAWHGWRRRAGRMLPLLGSRNDIYAQFFASAARMLSARVFLCRAFDSWSSRVRRGRRVS